MLQLRNFMLCCFVFWVDQRQNISVVSHPSLSFPTTSKDSLDLDVEEGSSTPDFRSIPMNDTK